MNQFINCFRTKRILVSNRTVNVLIKGGIHAKQLQADWKEEYLLKVLASGN